MNSSRSPVFHIQEEGLHQARAGKHGDRGTGQKLTPRGWPLVLRFIGREEGREEVTVRGRPYIVDGQSEVPLGWFSHFQRLPRIPGVCIPGVPERLAGPAQPLLWSRLLKEWVTPRIGRVPPPLRVAGMAPWVRIRQKSIVVPPAGYVKASMRELLAGDAEEAEQHLRQAQRYLHRNLPAATVWYAKDAEAAAWCEVLHAAENGAAAQACELCGTVYLRPRTYPVKLCPTCRYLNWRQQENIRQALPLKDRSPVAFSTAMRNLEAGGGGKFSGPVHHATHSRHPV